jgi:CDP-2,3-bis-(O-geranylgeranyl)-sn-glycerol synthase
MQRLLRLIYPMLPVYAANMAPPLVRYWPGRVRSISERWLGIHKTWQGYAFAVVAPTAVTLLQWRLDWSGGLADCAQWARLGPACGLGAMLGDGAKDLSSSAGSASHPGSAGSRALRRRGLAPAN